MISRKSVVCERNHSSVFSTCSFVSFRSRTRLFSKVVMGKPSKYCCFTCDRPHGWLWTCRTMFWNFAGGGICGWRFPTPGIRGNHPKRGDEGDHGDENKRETKKDRLFVYRFGIRYPSVYITAAQCFGVMSDNTSHAKNFAWRDWIIWFLVIPTWLLLSLAAAVVAVVFVV